MVGTLMSLPRSCAVGALFCEDAMGFDAGPLLVALIALAVIAFVITVVLGVRRRREILRSHDDLPPKRKDPSESD